MSVTRVVQSGVALAAASMLILGVGTAAPAGAWNPQPDPPKASLLGRVTDSLSGGPIDNVTVCLSNAQIPPPCRTTNNGGHYLFQGLPDGDYHVAACADGYQPLGPTSNDEVASSTIHIDGGDVAHFDFSLTPSETPPPCRSAFPRAGSS